MKSKYFCGGFIFLAAMAITPLSWGQADTLISGELYPAVEDHFTEGRAEHVYHLVEEKTARTVRLKFPQDKVPKEIQDLAPGSKIKIKGKKEKEYFAYDSFEGTIVSPSLTFASTTLKGERKVLAVRVNFSDRESVCTDASTQSLMFDDSNALSVKSFFRTTSKGQVSVSGEVATVTLPISSLQVTTCDYSSWSTQASNLLIQAGYTLSNYQHKMYILPSSVPCSWAGLGSLGGSSGTTWVKSCSARVMAHEIGHNFGLAHAKSEAGSEYGDYSDVMGSTYRELNAAHKHQLGWMPVEKVQTISGPGVYQISPLNDDHALDSLPQILRIFKADTNEYYYLSYRTKSGVFDSTLGAPYADRLNITRYKGSPIIAPTYFMNGLADGASLSLGNDLVVTSIARSSTSLELIISSNAVCSEQAPLVSLSNQEFIIKSGAALNGQISVTNRNNSACPSATFDITMESLSSITSQVSPATLLLGSTLSGSSSFNLDVLSSMADGSYSLPVDVVNRADAKLKTSAIVKVIVDNQAPSIPTALSLSTKGKNSVILNFQAASDNVQMGLYKILRNGIVIASITGTNFNDAGVSSGEQIYQVVAVDKAGNQSTAAQASISLGGAIRGRK